MQTKLAPVVLLVLATVGAVEAKEINILFMGNSFTLRHDLPRLVKQVFEEGQPGLTVNVEQITYGAEDCILLGRVTLHPDDGNRLLYTFSEVESRVDALAILVPVGERQWSYMERLLLTLNNIGFDYLLPEFFE